MDNKITKSRLHNLFSYKWITIFFVVALAIAALTVVYGAIGEKLTMGQRFFFYFDAETSAYNSDSLRKIVDEEKTFSFDVLEQNYEKIVVVEFQPTTENLLHFIAEKIKAKLPERVTLTCVRLRETDTSYAEWCEE